MKKLLPIFVLLLATLTGISQSTSVEDAIEADGSSSENNAIVAWGTTKPPRSYEVERSSDGNNYYTVYAAPANNYLSNSSNNLILGNSFVDLNVFALLFQSRVFYRVKGIYANGSYAYSNVVVITRKPLLPIFSTVPDAPTLPVEENSKEQVVFTAPKH